jgi:hypothetical protein
MVHQYIIPLIDLSPVSSTRTVTWPTSAMSGSSLQLSAKDDIYMDFTMPSYSESAGSSSSAKKDPPSFGNPFGDFDFGAKKEEDVAAPAPAPAPATVDTSAEDKAAEEAAKKAEKEAAAKRKEEEKAAKEAAKEAEKAAAAEKKAAGEAEAAAKKAEKEARRQAEKEKQRLAVEREKAAKEVISEAPVRTVSIGHTKLG